MLFVPRLATFKIKNIKYITNNKCKSSVLDELNFYSRRKKNENSLLMEMREHFAVLSENSPSTARTHTMVTRSARIPCLFFFESHRMCFSARRAFNPSFRLVFILQRHVHESRVFYDTFNNSEKLLTRSVPKLIFCLGIRFDFFFASLDVSGTRPINLNKFKRFERISSRLLQQKREKQSPRHQRPYTFYLPCPEIRRRLRRPSPQILDPA